MSVAALVGLFYGPGGVYSYGGNVMTCVFAFNYGYRVTTPTRIHITLTAQSESDPNARHECAPHRANPNHRRCRWPPRHRRDESTKLNLDENI